MGGGADVEQAVVARAVENRLAVAGGADDDRFLASGLDRQPVRAVEGRHHRIDIVQAVVAVESRVNHDGVSGPYGALPDHVPVPEAGAVICLQQAREVGFQLLAFVIRRIDVPNAAALVGPRLIPRADRDGSLGFSGRSVGVAQNEPAFVLGVRLDVEDAACETVRDFILQMFAPAEDALAADPRQGKRLTPCGASNLAERDADGGVAVRVAGNRPLEAQIAKRGMLHCEAARTCGVLSGSGQGGE